MTSTGDRHSIDLHAVTKIHPGAGGTPAVDGVSLSIAPGEFMTFLGPSGSGKTTTLSLIAGFTELTSGAISIDGVDVSSLAAHKRNLGVVFQQYALFPHMTVAKNIAYPLEQRKIAKARITEMVQASLELVDLARYRDRLPSQLSGGQQQRVALARAVVYQPRALLLDEPLAALDKKLRTQLQGEIARMHRELGMTFVFVTHDQEEALTLSDRIAVYNHGRIEQVGSPRELYESPATLFVGQFLGESNVFAGVEPGRLAIVRPEHLRILGRGESVPAGSLGREARVTEIVYAGSRNRVGLQYADGATGSLTCPTDSEVPAAVGADVTVCWRAANQSLVEQEAGSPDERAAAEPPVERAAKVGM